ncbi:MAG: LTA synthase family protein [Leptospiraceae bacterium]|nr:LTA synthase family protein [Leptospiraceae bacterium]
MSESAIIDITRAFIHGFRFDFAVMAQFLFIFVFLSAIHPLNKFKFYRNFWKFSPIPFIIYSISHLVGDFIYFENANKHLGYEGFVFFGKDFGVLLASAFESHLWLIIFFIFVCAGFSFLLIKLTNSIEIDESPKPFWKWFPKNLGIVLLTIILARGGFQNSFIGPGNAIVTDSPLLNQLVLNGIFTTIIDFKVEKFSKLQELNPAEAISITRKIIQYPGAEFVESPFPILRKTIPDPSNGKPDIMLVLLESWPAKYVSEEFSGVIDGKEITPKFNRLREKGVYFPRFFANGGRTSNGLVSILTGIPDRPGISMVHTKYSLNNFTGLGKLLKTAGYETTFYYGGQTSFENLTPIIKHWGFDTIYDYLSFEKEGNFEKGVWGYNDLDVYRQIINDYKNNKYKSPRLTVCLTLSTHHPFQIPDKSFERFPPTEDENKFINSLIYADSAIGEFISEFEKLPESKNTIIIFVSDHTSHRKLNYYEDRNIPFLVYAPWKYDPSVNKRISSQIDIIPTILGMVGHEFRFSSLGKDVFKDPSGQAYIAFGNIYGWGEEGIFFLDTVDEYNGLNFSINPPYVGRGPCKDNPLPCALPHKKGLAFMNTVEILLKKNLIAP